ncbi:MAG TPA: hypothetical protein VFU22_03360 [Roseiflexaceae bacterium]|nr:hypothetical protein [Roseiflexaceae bacterium]
MDLFSLDLVNQATTNLFIGFGFALVNVIVRYFAPRVPQVISVLRSNNRTRAIILAYLIALVIQLATSPFFRSLLHPVAYELAWSPYQAIFNVLGVIIMDVIVMAWGGMRRGAELGRRQLDVVKNAAADGLDEIGERLAITTEGCEQQSEADAKTAAERKQRIDDRLKDY